MKNTFSLFLSLFIFSSAVKAQELKPLCKKSPYRDISFKEDYVVTPILGFVKKMKVRDLKTNKVVKSKCETEFFPSNTVSVGDKWYFSEAVRGSKCAKATFNLVELGTDGLRKFETKLLDCEEKLGQMEMYGPGLVNTMVGFSAKMVVSKNKKYMLTLVSKSYTAHVNSGDYDESMEVCHFALADQKMNVLSTGSYDFKVKRKYISSLTAYVGDDGEIYIVLNASQEYVGVSNRTIVIKIKKEQNTEERVDVNLEKFNMYTYKTEFKNNKLIFAGLVTQAAKDEKNYGYDGVYFASVDLGKMVLLENNITLFSASHVTMFEEMVQAAYHSYLPWTDKERQYLRGGFTASCEILGESSFLLSVQFMYSGGDGKSTKNSQAAIIRVDDSGKKITDIYKYGSIENGVFQLGTQLLSINNKAILLYTDDRSAPRTYAAIFSENDKTMPVAKKMEGLKINNQQYLFAKSYFERFDDQYCIISVVKDYQVYKNHMSYLLCKVDIRTLGIE